ncbi:MAG: M23 family metallopeptidase [Candidatus Pacebacteria bacterium]|nr:M23 family metallopeptidase [Candidatus Paceibacterota bacterium]MBP9772607.1 M23 family metallopeptidase [Candidatus Paceibacterota bacterium]
MKIALYNKLPTKEVCFSVSIIGAFVMFPLRTEANILSIFGLSSTTEVHAETGNIEQNSQTMPILMAYHSPDPTQDLIEKTVTISDGALKSEVGPLGTLADVVEYDFPESDEISLYVVRSGDSIGAIAEMYGVSANTIMWANDLKKGDSLKEGQMLTILPITGVRHVVKKGETISSIAKNFNADAKEIAQFNGIIETASLSTGEILLIPDGEIAAPKVTKTAKTSSSGSKKEKTWGTSAPEQKGYYIRPLSGGRKSQGLHGFNGIDIAAPVGTPIYASASGTVIVSRSGGWGGGYGSYVVIKHSNGTQTLYAHMSKVSVPLGATVTQGQVIGAVGNTGRSTGPHLHFEIRGAKNPF